MAEFSFQNGSLKEFLEVKKYFHEVKTEDFQKYFYTYIKNRAKKLTIIGYLALIKDMQDYFSSKKEEILTDVLKNLMFASTVRLDDVDIRIINGKDICYIYDSSFLKYLESDREKNMKSQVRLLFSIDGEKILLKSVVKELTHKGKSHHKPLISSSSLRYFQRTSVSKGIRPTTEEKGLFLGLLDLKVGRGAEKEEIEKNKFLKGADVRILALVSRLLRKEKFVVILTNDTDISKIITKLKRKRKTRLIWEYCSVYGYFGGTQKLA